MEPLTIVEYFNVSTHRLPPFLMGFERITKYPFNLESVKECFCTGVVVGITFLAHAAA